MPTLYDTGISSTFCSKLLEALTYVPCRAEIAIHVGDDKMSADIGDASFVRRKDLENRSYLRIK